MYEEILVNYINESESAKESEKNRIEKIKKDFNKLRDLFLNQK